MAKKTRRMWTNQEKEEMLRATEGLSTGETKAYLKQHGIKMRLGSFRTLRIRYLKGHPEFKPEAIPVVKISTPPSPTEDFRAADDAGKRILIAEFKSLPNSEKDAWLNAHNVKRALLFYYAGRLKRNVAPKPAGRPKGSTSKALSVRQAMPQLARQQVIDIPLSSTSSRIIHVPTLAEAVTAFEVKRDHMNEFIGELKRMLHTGR